MSTSERPASATETGPSENAAAKPLFLVDQPSGTSDHAALNALLRDEGIRRSYENADEWVRWSWETIIVFLAAGDQPFNADSCRELGAPDPSHPNQVGALFMASCKAGVIKPVGFVQSTRRTRHAAWMRQWVGGDTR